MHDSNSNHIDHILDSVYRPEKVYDEIASIDPIILRSWRRCVTHYNLDPSPTRVARILTHQELEDHRLPVEEFLYIAKSGLIQLHKQVKALDYVILLADHKGITVDYIGNEKFDAELKESGLYLGADWNEMHSGTNGIGICTTDMQPVTVHQQEHFDLTNTTFTCTAAPIYDPEGKPLAVLDVSAMNSPKNKDSQYLLLQIVMQHAQNIENANFLHHFQKNYWIVRFGHLQEYVNVNAANILAIDESGVIAGLNTNARKLLTCVTTWTDKDWNQVIGKNITAIFDCDLENLIHCKNGSGKYIKPAKIMHSSENIFYSSTAPLSYKATLITTTKRVASSLTSNDPDTFTLERLTDVDPVMQKSIKLAKRLINSNVYFLIRGETGSGKEIMAKAIHDESRRSNKPFVAVNCAAIPESLIESELFGYRPGAFTGARSKGMIGLIQQSSGGTLFLDEIGDMPLHLQTRLLRVLSEREVMPLGADKPIPVDLNVISATHKCIEEMIQDGKFREDLYFRLAGATLILPPLRDRKDKEYIIKHAMLIESNGARIKISNETINLLMQYSWPGNIRELRNTLRIAYAFSDQCQIVPDDLPDDFLAKINNSFNTGASCGNHCDNHFDLHSFEDDPKIRQMITALRKNKWNITDTANELGVSRATIYRKMKKHNIVAPNNL